MVDQTLDETFATQDWLRLLAAYAFLHIAIHIFSKLKRYLRPERVASHVPAPDAVRGGSSLHGSLHAPNNYGNIGTYDALKSQCVPKAPQNMGRSQSFGLNPDELAGNIVCMTSPSGPRGGQSPVDQVLGDDENEVHEDKECHEDHDDLDEEHDNDTEASATRKQLRALYRTRAFKTWCVRNKLDSESLQTIFQRMHLYRKLREIHPASFWALCSPESLEGMDAADPSALTAAVEYVASRATDLSVAYLVYSLRDSLVVAMVLSYALVVRHWARGRSSGAWMFRMWYSRVEEDDSDVGLFRAAVANILEDLFVVGSLGVGALLSLSGLVLAAGGDARKDGSDGISRASEAWRQSTGERVAGIRLQQSLSVFRGRV